MDQLFSSLKKIASLLTVILLLTAAGCTLLTDLGSFDNGFFPVIGNLILLVVEVVLIGGVAVLLLMKKDDLAKKALGPVFAWWMIGTILSGISRSALIDSRYEGLTVTIGVFSFLAALALLAAGVFFVLGTCGKTKFYPLGWLLFAIAECVFFIVMVITLVRVAANDYYGWQSFVGAIGDFAFGLGLFFAALYMWYAPAAKEQAALPAAEEASDAPAEESKTEE